jgi:hypothetical protein
LRLRWVAFDLPSQPQDLHVDRPIVDLGVVQAGKLEQLIKTQNAPGP